MAISREEALGIYTRTLPTVFNDKIAPKNFLRSFFKVKTSPALNVSTEIKRNGELVAGDVMRGSDGNINSFSKSTQRIYTPPFYKEGVISTELDYYDRVFGTTGDISAESLDMFIDEVADKLSSLQAKIERAYELQCSQAIFDRIVQVNNGDNITFPKKSESEINANTTSGAYFDNASSKPSLSFIAAGAFLRSKGKAQGGVFDCVCGESAWNALLNSTEFQKFFTATSVTLTDAIGMNPINPMLGAAYQGRVKYGSYLFDFWTYPETYDTVSGGTVTSNSYVPTKKIAVIPKAPAFEFRYAGVPTLIEADGMRSPVYMSTPGEFHIRQYNDDRKAVTVYEVTSAGLAVPVAIDQIAVITALA